jgi:hypothetical protein
MDPLMVEELGIVALLAAAITCLINNELARVKIYVCTFDMVKLKDAR